MFDVGGGELVLIVLAIIVLFGPKKIPEIAQMVGKGMQKVRQAQSQFQSHVNDFKSDINLNTEPTKSTTQPTRDFSNPPVAEKETSGEDLPATNPANDFQDYNESETTTTKKNSRDNERIAPSTDDPYGLNEDENAEKKQESEDKASSSDIKDQSSGNNAPPAG